MGASSSTEEITYPMAPCAPLGLYPKYTSHTDQITLTGRPKLNSDYSVKDAVTRELVLTAQAKSLLWSGEKNVLDSDGNSILTLRTRSFWTTKPKIDGFDTQSLQSGTIPSTPILSVEFTSSRSANITFRNRCSPDRVGQDVKLLLETKRYSGKYTVLNTKGQLVMQMSPSKRKARETLLTIAPGVDVVLVTAIYIIVTAVYSKSQSGGVGAGGGGGN